MENREKIKRNKSKKAKIREKKQTAILWVLVVSVVVGRPNGGERLVDPDRMVRMASGHRLLVFFVVEDRPWSFPGLRGVGYTAQSSWKWCQPSRIVNLTPITIVAIFKHAV